MIQPKIFTNLKKQALTTPPFVNDNTLVDDPVALVDDPIALSGGPTVTINNIRPNVRPQRYYTKVQKRR